MISTLQTTRQYFALFSIVIFTFCCKITNAQKKDVGNIETADRKAALPNALYEEWRISESPNNNLVVSQNPVALLWRSEKYWENKNVLYKVYLSQDNTFPKDKTIEGSVKKYCFYNPHEKLSAGQWFWKYDIIEGDKKTTKGTFSFTVNPESTVFETPKIEKLLANIPKSHPRVMNFGKSLDEIRLKSKTHPLYQKIFASGTKVLGLEIYRGPVTDPDPAKNKALTRITGNEVGNYRRLLEAYVLSGDKKMLSNLLQRTHVFLGWPTDDLLGSQVLTSLAMGYDVLFDELPESDKKGILAVIKKQLVHGLDSWPGKIEARQVENHFWQMEVAGNFTAALATLGDLKESQEMLEYTYELFMARFPNLATQEGGWAEGIGYFGVNKSSIIDMPLLLKKVCGVDVFKMNWYKNLADYFDYFAPVDGRISGFGDMHDRVGNGNVGHAMMMVVGYENNDEKAKYRLAQLLKASKSTNEEESWFESRLESIEPWYQIVNDLHFNPDKINAPKNIPEAKLFKGVGIAALHTDVLNSEKDMAVYFRSSPFGAKGHMHANQNCFNISRKGEPVFYSTGYYTTFADPHSLTSYRHTRAHNGILVDGMGQAFGHEGYGWIKRFVNGERIAYVCGDASKAYQPMVDKQFIELNTKNGIIPGPETGFGDAGLKTFERHLIFVKPNTVIIYDVLESKKGADWSLLLHTMKAPQKAADGSLQLSTDKNDAIAHVFGSSEVNLAITNKFYSPAIDLLKKYKSLPDQFHITSNTLKKSDKMRYLTIIQLDDKGKKNPELNVKDNSVFSFGDIVIKAELDTSKAPSISILTKQDAFYVNKLPGDSYKNESMLIEKNGAKERVTTSKNMDPAL